MVVGETQNGTLAADDMDENDDQKQQSTQQFSGINQATIDNIMSGIENTGAVKMNNHRKKLRQRFDIIKKLGQGTYGKVQLGINKETGQEVAIKTIKKSKIETEADLIRIRREVQIMSSVQHPNIIHIYEVFENREKMVLVMEFAAGGELYDYLSDRKVLGEEEARRIFRQVSTAIYYCHKHKICHRDLKLENILLDEHGNAKIADFGLSNVFDEQRLLATFCGSPLYASPEIVKGTPYHGPEVDCWSLGVLLYTLVYGAMPFDGANFKRLVKQISQGDYFEPKSPSRASPLIREMLTCCPIRRANIEQICSHWWVNEDYNENCLDLAEELANQTPVRLDVLLSLAPPSVTSEQVVVPSHEENNKERIQKSHSVGSIIDIAETEAERRILDMVAAGGEKALMPSPTRTMTPQESPMQQSKRKLESTVSTENATGGAKKKEKPISSSNDINVDQSKSKLSIPEVMEIDIEKSSSPIVGDVDEKKQEEEIKQENVEDVQESLKKIEELCDELMEKTDKTKVDEKPPKQIEAPTLKPEEVKKEAIKKISSPVKRDMVKHKTLDLSSALSSLSKDTENSTSSSTSTPSSTAVTPPQQTKSVQQMTSVERQNSLPDDSATTTTTKPVAEKRRSRILETAEKFQNMNNQNNEKYKKFSIPGVSVGNFKKEFERKASITDAKKTSAEKRDLNENNNDIKKPIQDIANNSTQSEKIKDAEKTTGGATAAAAKMNSIVKQSSTASTLSRTDDDINQSDSKSSVASFSIEDAKRSMENSIALLQKARNESQSKDVDNLCAKTESFTLQPSSTPSPVNDMDIDRQRKLQAARDIIGNAIPPSRLIGIRKPPIYGLNGRSVSGGVIQSPFKSNSNVEQQQQRSTFGRFTSMDASNQVVPEKIIQNLPEPPETTKTSHAEITLKSATLPRRKPTKMEIQVEIKPKMDQSQSTRFTTEVHHQVPDTLQSAPIRETPTTYASFTVQNRSNSLEPKEHLINIQKPPTYQRNASSAYRNTLSRQSTNESNDSDTTPTQSFIQSSSTINSSGDKQPIKKSPREFIIPISIEGGGIVTPKLDSTPEQGEAQRMSRTKRISSIFSERDVEEDTNSTVFPKLHRHTSLNRESDTEEPRFHSMHRLRSSRPTKRSNVFSQDPNESDSGDEDDDDDGFELLTAENLFSTLLSRVRALTHRLNVNNETTSNFPSTRFMNNIRQSQSPFWNNDPFGSKCTSYKSETITETIKISSRTNLNPWRTNNLARDLHSDFDSMFSRSGATLPRGKTPTNNSSKDTNDRNNNNFKHEILDLGDLDLSQLRLTKKDLETLSSITPSLSKNLQDQLLAQLPPNQAKKLSRTLSIQNQNNGKKTSETTQIYRRSVSSGAKSQNDRHNRDSVTPTNEVFDTINNNTIRNASQHRKSASREDKLFDDSVNNNNNGSMYRERTLSPDGYRYQKNSNRTSSPSEDIERACFSPPPLDEKKTKRYSRSMAIYDEPRKPELATHKILREMREKSHETEKDDGNKNSYYQNKYMPYNGDVQNRSFNAKESTTSGNSQSQSSSVSSSINNKILDELNSISLLNNQLEKYDQLEIQNKEKSMKKKISTKSSDETSKKSTKLKEKVEEIKPPETKLVRPKSFIKEVPLKPITQDFTTDKLPLDTNKLERPKSFPNSKLTPPKELKKLPEIDQKPDEPKSVEEPAQTEPKKVKKVIKVVKKSSKKASPPTSVPTEVSPPEPEVTIPKKEKEKSPEKKGGKGLLYTIGQKFEKLRDTKAKKSDEVKDEKKIESSTLDLKEKKKKIKAMLNEDVDEITRQERKSKIDALIKNLKDKTVPNVELTESGLIKRAVSVEEMPNTFNKNAVNKVLGLFKRIEKENENKSNRVQNTKSTSFLSSMDPPTSLDYYANHISKERPKSSGFVNNKHHKNCSASFEPLANICESKIPVKYSCPDCKTNPSIDTINPQPTNVVTKRHSNDEKQQQTSEEKERLKNNRKGLMLDFSRFKSPEPEVKDKKPANYSFPPPLPEVNRNVTPTYDNLANYSSSAFDASISSSLSPNDEICNDGWSTCSDDHTISTHHPLGSASLSRLSKSNYIDEPESPPESVVDRIRRKSFYSRFNEKKTKRVSNIVGPAAKDYYRERSKPLEYTRSATSVIPDILSSSARASSVEAAPSHHSRASSISRYIPTSSAANRSLSQTRSSTKYTNDTDPLSSSSSSYRRNESNHLATLPPPYHVHHSHHHHELSSSSHKASPDDVSKIKSNRNTMYDSSSSSSNTPSSLSSLYTKRRSYVSSSPSSATTNSTSYYTSSKPPLTFVDGYATIGRKMRQYNTRSVSLLDPNIINSSHNNYDHYRINGNIESNGNSTRSLRSSVPRNDNI